MSRTSSTSPSTSTSIRAEASDNDINDIDEAGESESPDDDYVRKRAIYMRKYIRHFQAVTTLALERVTKNPFLVNNGWSEPLYAAPMAVLIMTFLENAAESKQVAGLTLPSLDILSLASFDFHINFKHCSELGRHALLEAQGRMDKINGAVDTIIHNLLYCMIELLEDPDDAKRGLPRRLEELEDNVRKCENAIFMLKTKYECWYLFINHLNEAVKDIRVPSLRGAKKVTATTIGIQNNADELDDKTKLSIKKYDAEHEMIIKEIDKLEDRINKNSKHISIGQENLSILVEYSDLSSPGSGEDHNYSALKESAEQLLRENTTNEVYLHDEYNTIKSRFPHDQNRLSSAKRNLNKAIADVRRLGRGEMELEEIITILEESTKNTAELKAHFSRLDTFFSAIKTGVDTRLIEQVERFRRLFQYEPKNSSEQDERDRLAAINKERSHHAAFQVLALISPFADISLAYAKVFENFILPMLSQMKKIGHASGDEGNIQDEQISKYCERALQRIDKLVRKTDYRMNENTEKRMMKVSTYALQAAEYAYESDYSYES